MKEWLKSIFATEPQTKKDVIEMLHNAVLRKIIDNDCLPMLEALVHIDDLKALDVLIPRHQMDVLDINDSIENIIDKVIATGHSRFPVINGQISEILGIFHSKDLVQYYKDPKEFDLKDHLRKAYFVPELKHLDSLMYEMRLHHSHLVIVVDEFTNVVGLITLEMIIEQIIGDIEDEYDSVEGERRFTEIKKGYFRVKGFCKLTELSREFGIQFRDKTVETISGFIVKFLGRIPVNGEIIQISHYNIEIISADQRKINILLINKI